MGDTGNAMLAAIAIVAALYHRERTGEGQAVSTSIVNAGLFHTSYAWIHADGAPGGWGHVDGGQHGLSPYYRLYQCAEEGWLFLAAVTAQERDRLTAMLRQSENLSLDANPAEKVLSSCFGRRTAAEWVKRLDGCGVPAEYVDESFCRTVFDDPEARKSQLVAQTWSGSVGTFEDPGLLVNVEPASCVIQRGPSMCGEHTREILVEHGYSNDEVDALVADQAVLEAVLETS